MTSNSSDQQNSERFTKDRHGPNAFLLLVPCRFFSNSHGMQSSQKLEFESNEAMPTFQKWIQHFLGLSVPVFNKM